MYNLDNMSKHSKVKATRYNAVIRIKTSVDGE